MRANTSPHIQVKAAGGVRTLDALLDVMALGVTRVGRDRDGGDHRRLPGTQGRRRPGRRPRPAAPRNGATDRPSGPLLMRTEAADATATPPALDWLTAADRPPRAPGRDARREAIETASQWCADAIAADGLVHLFGTGHSRIPVEEMFPRYGSYPGFNPIVELSMTFHTQVVGANGQRQAMFIERTPGPGRGHPVELHVRAAGRADRVLGQRPVGRPGRDGPRRPSAWPARHRGNLRRTIDVRPSRIRSSGGAYSTRRISSSTSVRRTPTRCARSTAWTPRSGPGSTISAVAIVNCIKVRTAQLLVERGALPAVSPEHRS